MPAIFTVSGVSTTLTSPIHDYKLKTDDDTCEIVCHIYATSQFTHAKRRRKKKKKQDNNTGTALGSLLACTRISRMQSSNLRNHIFNDSASFTQRGRHTGTHARLNVVGTLYMMMMPLYRLYSHHYNASARVYSRPCEYRCEQTKF